MKIHVTPLSQVSGVVQASGALHLLSLLSPGHAFAPPTAIREHLLLDMNDIVEAREGLIPPTSDHVVRMIDFAGRWDRRNPLVINCQFGISRSTAAAFVVAAALMPECDETALAAELRRRSPSATPNMRIIDLADRLLMRGGRMVRAIETIGRGADAREGRPFVLELLLAGGGDPAGP